MICSTFPVNLVMATSGEMIITEEMIEEELNNQLEDLLIEASQQAEEIVEDLNLLDEYIENENNTDDILEFDEEAYRQWKLNLAEGNKYRMSISSLGLQGNIMSNEYIAVSVHEDGRFNMGTTGGNPDVETDNNKPLLFGFPNSNTSFTTIRIDGEDYDFKADDIPQFNPQGTEAISTMTIGDIIIKQIITFEVNTNTGREDTGRIRYEVINNGDTFHDIGIRIMMDTMLGNNDGAPFKIPGIGNVVKEVEIVGYNVPQYWQAFDNLDNPSIIASGAFYKSFNEKPDKVQFAAWPSIYGTKWDYEVDSGREVTRDSAVAIYYDPKSLGPKESKTIDTYYGIGDFALSDTEDELSLRVTAPQKLEVNSQTGSYYSNPFTITAYVKNNSSAIAQNVKIDLNLPEELNLIDQKGSTLNIGDLGSGEERTVSFTVLAQSQTTDKKVNYNIKLYSDNLKEKTLNFTLDVPKATISQDGSIILNKNSLNLVKGDTYILRATLNNIKGTVTWFSDNPSVAKINSSGLVTARSAGTANIKASVGGKVATCRVAVAGSKVSITGLSFSPSTVNLGIDESQNLKLVFTPSNAPNKRIKSWTSSNPSVASVTPSGRVKGLKKGTAIIKAVSEEGNITAECKVNVTELEPILETGEGIDFKAEAKGPSIKFAGKEFPLFKIPIGTQLIFKDKVKLVYDNKQGKFTGYLGDFSPGGNTNEQNTDGTLTDRAKQMRIDTYQTIKKMMNMVGKKTNREFYNSYRKLVQKSSPFSVNGNQSKFGYVEVIKTSNGYSLAAGEICVLFSAGVSWKYNFPPAPVVYVKFGISGSLQTGLKLKLTEAGNLKGGIDVAGKVEGKLSPSLGVGGDVFAAKVEGGIEGNIKSVINLRPYLQPRFSAPRDFELSLNANLYLKYKAFKFINAKHTLPIVNYKIYPQEKQKMMRSAVASIDYDDLVPMPRDYIKNPSYFMGDRPKVSTFAMNNSNIDNRELKTNIYPDGEPKLVQLANDNMFLVWIDDDINRDNESNYTALYYSIFDGSIWSEPQQIDNDGTADFAPCVINHGDRVYIAWQNAEIKFAEDVTPEIMAKNMGIKVAIWENGQFNISEISKPDNTLDNPPTITTDGINLAVVWTKNKANDIFGIEGETTILRSVFNGESWSDAKEVLKSNNMINGLTTSFDEGKNIIIYSQDTDGDIATFEDRELMMIVDNEAPINITNNNIADINPILITNEDETELYWYSEEGIFYKPSLKSEETFNIQTDKPIGANFKIISNGEDKVIIWENSQGYKADLQGIFYDNELKQWGDVIKLVDLDSRIRDTSGVLAKDGTIYLSYIKAPVLENPIEEVSPFGNADLMFTQLKPGYDLVVDNGIAFDDRLIYEGSELSLGCYVENLGQNTIDGLIATIYNGDSEVSRTEIDVKIGSGKGEFVDIPYQLPEELRAHEVWVTIVPKNGMDYDMENNSAKVTIGEANIIVEKPTVTGMGSNRTITAEIKNLGYSNSEAIKAEFVTVRGDDSEIKGSTIIGSIPSQGSRIVEFNLPIDKETFSSISEDDIIGFINVMYEDTEDILDFNFVQIPNVYELDYITLSSVAMAGNTIILNMDNNIPEPVEGLICVESIGEDGNAIIYSQSIDAKPLYGESIQLDLSGVEMDYSTIKVYVQDEEDKIISNVVDIHETNKLKVLKPSPTPIAGVYKSSQRVSLATSTEGAKIYYTIDGSEPTIDSRLYTEPINVDKTITIKAKAVKEGMLDSEIQVFQYIIEKDSPTEPSTPSPSQPTETLVSGDGKAEEEVKEKTFLEEFNGLSKEQKSKIMDSIPYTFGSNKLSIEALKKITHDYFTDKQLKEIVDNPEIIETLLKEKGVNYKIITLVPTKNLLFKDLKENHWAISDIKKATELGFIEGYKDNTFRPDKELIVADTFTFLDRVLIANNIVGGRLPRSIVEKYIKDNKHWAFYSIASISSRLSESTLKEVGKLGDGTVSRELLAQALYEITEGKLPRIKELTSFEDMSKSKYKEALEYCIEIGLLEGTSNKTMKPKKSITRAEMITILSRLNSIFRGNE